MATTSFDKKFVVKTKEDSEKLLKALDKPQFISVNKKDLAEESKLTLELLKKEFKS